ncbi:hypothetical protein BDV12DRAFT_206010 [Aspergillus spectabilis]
MTATLASLPLETLTQICDYLSDHNFNLHAFSLINKRCNAASSRARFQSILVAFRTREDFQNTTKQWTKTLDRHRAYLSVQHITIEGRLPARDEDSDTQALFGHVDYDQGDDEFTRPGDYYDHIIRGPFYHLGVQEEQGDEAWQPLAALLMKLTNLRDLVYACESQFPKNLWKVLQCILPQCRLHLKAFDPPFLTVEEEEEEWRDEGYTKSDYALAMSPNLFSAVVPVAYDDDYRGHNEETARLLVRGIAPNLKEVHIIDSGPGFKYRLANRGESSGAMPAVADIRKAIGKDVQLEFLSLDPANGSRLKKWEKTVLFSRLRSLHLWRVPKEALFKAAKCKFKSLKSLALGLLESCRARSEISAIAFLKSLVPLEAIHISGSFHIRMVETILERHGVSLQKLSLYPFENGKMPQLISSHVIRSIQVSCANLRDLRLQIKRRAGDHGELAIYRALGEMQNLQNLTLQLEVHSAGIPSHLILPESQHVRGIFINMAVDAELARQVFWIIGRKSALESLTLKLGANVGERLFEISQIMERRWKCVRIGNGDPGESGFIVQELGEKSRKRRMEAFSSTKLGKYESTFRDLWPAKTGDWRYDWHSFPLQIERDN